MELLAPSCTQRFFSNRVGPSREIATSVRLLQALRLGRMPGVASSAVAEGAVPVAASDFPGKGRGRSWRPLSLKHKTKPNPTEFRIAFEKAVLVYHAFHLCLSWDNLSSILQILIQPCNVIVEVSLGVTAHLVQMLPFVCCTLLSDKYSLNVHRFV